MSKEGYYELECLFHQTDDPLRLKLDVESKGYFYAVNDHMEEKLRMSIKREIFWEHEIQSSCNIGVLPTIIKTRKGLIPFFKNLWLLFKAWRKENLR